MGSEIQEESANGAGCHPDAGYLRQIAMEHEIEVISGEVVADHVHMFGVTWYEIWSRNPS